MRNLLLALSIFSFVSCDTLSSLPGIKGPVTESEAGEGIRQALSQGVNTAIFQLNKENGFFGNNAYKLLLPPDATRIESVLRNIGMGKQVDKAILQINRAAEDAVGYAKPIFVNAITEMSISDALQIIRGGSDAATNYFRQKTREQLIQAFTPRSVNR